MDLRALGKTSREMIWIETFDNVVHIRQLPEKVKPLATVIAYVVTPQGGVPHDQRDVSLEVFERLARVDRGKHRRWRRVHHKHVGSPRFIKDLHNRNNTITHIVRNLCQSVNNQLQSMANSSQWTLVFATSVNVL